MFVHLRMFYYMRTVVYIRYDDHSFKQKNYLYSKREQNFINQKQTENIIILKSGQMGHYNLNQEEIFNERYKSKKIRW